MNDTDREIVLDTETTGLYPDAGDRLVEVGCVELVNFVPSGRTFHRYINPQRDVPAEAFRVHGLSAEFLRDKPLFSQVCEEFLTFIGSARLVIHNAEFDIKFLNAELDRCGRPPLAMGRVTDTLALARKKHPGSSNNLDALCTRYKIDNSRRTKHGALLDAEILAEVYGELIGGRQTTFTLPTEARVVERVQRVLTGSRPHPIDANLTPQELSAHADLIGDLGEKSIWGKYTSS